MPMSTREIKTDILVVGGGLSGCFAAIRAKQLGADVVLVDKGYIGRTGISKFASTHIRFYLPEDDMEDAIKEIVEGGDYMSDQRWVEAAVRESFDRVKDMDSFGVTFEKENGRIRRVPSKGRIAASAVFHSPQMMLAMRRAVERSSVRILDRVFINELLTAQDGTIIGAIGIHVVTGDFYVIYCKSVVLAAGPCTLRSIFHGHQFSTGDAYSMAYKVGATFMNMECTHHNTSARDYNTSGMGHWVGSGGKFINSRGEAFMARYHPQLKDRANLTWIARAMATEVKEGRGPIYFDFSNVSKGNFQLAQKTMPWALLALTKANIDFTSDKVEWVAAFLGSCGSAAGIKVDMYGSCGIPGLYATGDTAAMVCLGMGAGFGGFNLTYCAVFGYRAGEGACNFVKSMKKTQNQKVGAKKISEMKQISYNPLTAKEGASADEALNEIQKVIFPYQTCILKSEDRLKRALDSIEECRNDIAPQMVAPDIHELIKVHETNNMVLYAEMYLRSSLFRNESRGMHYREDHPVKDDKHWISWVHLQNVDAQMKLWAEPVPKEAFSHFTLR
jgi:succinate dehydrogenase / fumarate reductase flavoprotein subunit